MSFDHWLAEQADQRRDAGLERSLVSRAPDDGLVDLAGNDYLGLSRDARVVSAASGAAHHWGAGAGASRLVTGTLGVHDQLEAALAAWVGTESALVHSTGYHANLSAVTALADADTLIVSDAHVHASLVDACRLARSRVEVYPHNDVAVAEKLLAERNEPHAVVMTESVFSVLSDEAPLTALAATAAAHDAVLLVDEAHGLGVTGNGHGSVHALGLAGLDHVIVTMTLSKAMASQGGVVLGPQVLRNHLINRSRPFIYDTGLNPPACAAALAALQILQAEPDRPMRIHTATNRLAEATGVPPAAGPVVSIPMPGPHEAVAAADLCLENGVRVGSFRPPSTPDGLSRLRLTAHAGLSATDLERAGAVIVDAIGQVS
jgi:8-amino-7-oxononanoate synthase